MTRGGADRRPAIDLRPPAAAGSGGFVPFRDRSRAGACVGSSFALGEERRAGKGEPDEPGDGPACMTRIRRRARRRSGRESTGRTARIRCGARWTSCGPRMAAGGSAVATSGFRATVRCRFPRSSRRWKSILSGSSRPYPCARTGGKSESLNECFDSARNLPAGAGDEGGERGDAAGNSVPLEVRRARTEVG